jgi:pantothenate kinase-related protein Tda10
VICVLVVQRKQQDSCEREEQLLIEGWTVGFVTGNTTLVEISVDDYDNTCSILFSVNTKHFHSPILFSKHM